jgi:hypothetical protein
VADIGTRLPTLPVTSDSWYKPGDEKKPKAGKKRKRQERKGKRRIGIARGVGHGETGIVPEKDMDALLRRFGPNT